MGNALLMVHQNELLLQYFRLVTNIVQVVNISVFICVCVYIHVRIVPLYLYIDAHTYICSCRCSELHFLYHWILLSADIFSLQSAVF